VNDESIDRGVCVGEGCAAAAWSTVDSGGN
jgi:hypothetical protein